LCLLVVLGLAMPLAAQGQRPSAAPVPLKVASPQHVFAEIPGVRQLSSRVIVRPYQRRALLDAGFSLEQTESLAASARRELGRFDLLRHVPATDESILIVPPGMSEAQVADRLMASGVFEYVDPDWILSPLSHQLTGQSAPRGPAPAPSPNNFPLLPLPDSPHCPDDPFFFSQWHHQPGVMDSCAAWNQLTGGPSVSIGICDTGIRTTHEDLLLHRLEGYNAVDRLWESEGGNINPVHVHGTRTTGTAMANGNNGVGVSGVGWNLSHRMLRVSNVSTGNAFLSDIQEGARTSIESGDRVANVSYHGASSASNPATATYIKSIGGLLLWGAGNTSTNYSGSDRDDDDLIVVGSTDPSDNLASFSSYGTFIDLVAPGTAIMTTSAESDSTYVSVQGTSYSSPLAAGVCAMIWSARPNLSPNDVERILKLGAEDIGLPGLDQFFGYGRINLNRSVTKDWSTVPVAGFATVPASGASPLAVSFTDLSIGVPTSWLWDFGDGQTSTEPSPDHTYTALGAYDVTLTVVNALGADVTVQVGAVLVDVIPPVAAFSAAPMGGLSPLLVQFTDESTGGAPTSWFWDFGDGATSTLQHPSHTYTSSGFYTVSLSVTNSYGNDSLSLTDVVAVDFIPPVAGFSGAPVSAPSPFVVDFTDESTGGAVTSWAWTFGDGYGSNASNPSHTYTAAGTYSVSLTVSNAYGSDLFWRTGYIEVLPGPELLANFVGAPMTGTAPLTVDFTDLSIGNISAWDWNFGDGVTSALQHPSHTFTSPGQYDIALSVENAGGKDDQLELQAYVTVQ